MNDTGWNTIINSIYTYMKVAKMKLEPYWSILDS